MKEQTFKLNLVNEENESEILCSISGYIAWESEDGEDVECYFQNPMNGSFGSTPKDALSGWEEVEEDDNNNWEMLCNRISEDDTFLEWFAYEDEGHEEKNYCL